MFVVKTFIMLCCNNERRQSNLYRFNSICLNAVAFKLNERFVRTSLSNGKQMLLWDKIRYTLFERPQRRRCFETLCDRPSLRNYKIDVVLWDTMFWDITRQTLFERPRGGHCFETHTTRQTLCKREVTYTSPCNETPYTRKALRRARTPAVDVSEVQEKHSINKPHDPLHRRSVLNDHVTDTSWTNYALTLKART